MNSLPSEIFIIIIYALILFSFFVNEQTRYSYMLEDLESKWISLPLDRVA